MCTVNRHRNRRILPYLPLILTWSDREYWEKVPEDWSDMDIAHRERRVRPGCMICGDPSGFCRVVMTDDCFYWADLCSEHTDPDNLVGLQFEERADL